MWPWEHVILGYLVYSVFCHTCYRDSPREYETIAVVVASVLPDVIDKPLSWQFDLFQSGYAMGHSIFVAGILAITAPILAWKCAGYRIGLAFVVGHLLHLVGDVVPIYLSSGEWSIRHLLWPVVGTDGIAHDGFVIGVRQNLLPYVETIRSLDPTPYLLLQLGLVTIAFLLWNVDGRPGWRPLLNLDRARDR